MEGVGGDGVPGSQHQAGKVLAVGTTQGVLETRTSWLEHVSAYRNSGK